MNGTLPSPFECSPPGCAGWEEMYVHHALFVDARRDYDEGRFWFQEGLHWPEPIRPFDAVVVEALFVGLNQSSARLFAIPPSLGAEYRVLGGYVYSSPNVLTDAGLVARTRRAVRAARGLLLPALGRPLRATGCARSSTRSRSFEGSRFPGCRTSRTRRS